MDLIKKNSVIFKDIVIKVMQSGFDGIFVVATNPLDVMTYLTYKYSGLSPNKVIGSGTILDTARLRYLIGDRLRINAKNVHAYVIGEHGDSEFVPWSNANIGLQPINNFLTDKEVDDICNSVRNAAYEIIEKKGGKDYNPYTAGKEGDPYSADVAPANSTSVFNLGQTRSHWNDTSTGVKYTPGEGESTQRTNANCDYDRLFIDLALSYSYGEQKLNTLDNLDVGFIIEYKSGNEWVVWDNVSFSSKELGDKNRIEYYYGFKNSPELREVDLKVTPTIGGVKSGNTLAFNFKDAKFS